VPIRGVIFNDAMPTRPGRYGRAYTTYGYASHGNDVPT
jgi:tyrosine-protein kinase Etk/Wzc